MLDRPILGADLDVLASGSDVKCGVITRWFGNGERVLKSLKSEFGRKAIHLGAIILPIGYYILPETQGRRILLRLQL